MSKSRIDVKHLPKDPGPAAWNAILPNAPTYPELEGDIHADWLIIGAGFAGLSAAQRLLQLTQGEEIVVLEARRLADGPSGRNSGFMIDLPHELNSETYAGAHEQDIKQIQLNRAAINFARDMAHEYNLDSKIFAPCGKMTAAGSDKGIAHINSYCKHLENLGESYQLKDAQQMQAWTGSSFYKYGLYTPGAVMIQPAAFIREVAKGLSDKIRIFENSPAISLERGKPHVVATPKGRVHCKGIIMAVNGHIQSFGFYPKKLLHVFTYASMTRTLTSDEVECLGGASDWGILPADPLGTTVRRCSDYQGSGDRIVIRNHATLNQSIEASTGNMRRAARLQDRSFKNRFPMLEGIEMEYRWGGRLCLTWNSVPAFGELEPGIWSACCQNGLGTVKGTLSGMMAAELAVLGDSDHLRDFMDYSPPRRLPPEPFLSLGANSTMRIKEWQAGIEL
ncbi:NAD(P)/FAD-dependent oxidoreductase [Oceanospirillum sediminis]|uniref:FAD-binding oxidoreductase n=1 Tax=Oceanospirillum sediminis TaxID=2760088 RepID=A0A839IS21_9GAMM|nr:FAD-binding oxidoreductase [Oceanospirillum sediminis]MBB1488273.1 FAD-binding oxidoreductase [Oceanospirillum sediminis]